MLASIDIGTNTIRLLIAEAMGGTLRKMHVERVVTRLGGGFSGNADNLTPAAMERTLAALTGFASRIEAAGAQRTRVVATSVVREAVNRQRFLGAVRDETGLEVEVVSGEQEARLTVMGVLSTLDLLGGEVLVFDIGGGSTEYIHARDGAVEGIASTSLGVVHLAERFLRSAGVPTGSAINALGVHIETRLRTELRRVIDSVGEQEGLTLVGTAGTPTTLAAIDLELTEYDPGRINGHVLGKPVILKIYETLINLTGSERMRIKGLEKGREDLIIPGSLICLETLELFGASGMVVSDGGLLEGAALSLIE